MCGLYKEGIRDMDLRAKGASSILQSPEPLEVLSLEKLLPLGEGGGKCRITCSSEILPAPWRVPKGQVSGLTNNTGIPKGKQATTSPGWNFFFHIFPYWLLLVPLVFKRNSAILLNYVPHPQPLSAVLAQVVSSSLMPSFFRPSVVLPCSVQTHLGPYPPSQVSPHSLYTLRVC